MAVALYKLGVINAALDGLSMGQFIEFFKSNGIIAELHSADGSVERASGPTFVSTI